MASFEDDSRKRMVSMARGKDTKTKEDFTRSVREDREKRALERKREKSAIVIQKNARGFLTRKRERIWFKTDFLQKVKDIVKLELIVGAKQPRFVARASAVKLIRECLFVGETESREMVSGLLTVLSRCKPRVTSTSEGSAMDVIAEDDKLSAGKFRDASLLAFLLKSPLVTSSTELERIVGEEQLLKDDANGFILASVFRQALIRACYDAKFIPWALQSLKALELRAAQNVQTRTLVLAFVQASQINSKCAGDVLAQSPVLKDIIYDALAGFVEPPRLSSTKTKQLVPLYGAGPLSAVMADELAIRQAKKELVLPAIVHSFASVASTANANSASTAMKFSRALVRFLTHECLQKPPAALAFVCEPTRVSQLLTLARADPQALLTVAAMYFKLLDVTLEGLSARSRILLGAITSQNKDTLPPPVCFAWDVLLSSTSVQEGIEPLLNFACLATGLLLESLDDDELFYNPRKFLPLALVERIVLFLKGQVYDSIWSKFNPSASQDNSLGIVIDLFHQLSARCARHPDKISPKIWLFPTISPAELGLGSTPANQMRFSQVNSASGSGGQRQEQEGEGEEEDGEEEEEQAMVLLTAASIRGQQILRTVPMCVPFEQRVQLFHRHLERYKAEHRDDTPRWNELTQQVEHPSRVQCKVRRGSVVEDAFAQLADKNLTGRLQVQFVNDLGLEEAGIDGGGLFKEFITQFCHDAFDPNRGLFQRRNAHSQELFPVLQFTELKLLEFVGKVLGKAVYENVLVEPEIAPFVLNIVRGKRNGVHDLQSLDVELYRHLLSLKRMSSEDLESLSLTFTATTKSVSGQVMDVELCKDGKNVLVTKENVLLYVEAVANFRLNRELLLQMDAFARGFHSLIDPAWIRLFSAQEFAMLIGGTAKDFSVSDLRRHVVYGGGYHPSQPYVQEFWDVVERDLTPDQRGKLLKFITSCSRPPLTGFQSLEPLITVYQVRDDVERLPTASTCVNLLKLPKYPSRQILREKLVLAIESGAGFELS